MPHYDQRMTEQLKRSLLATASESLAQWGRAAPFRVQAQAGDDPTSEWLTLREREVLRLVGQGLRNRDIGRRLYLSEKTVRNCVSAILGKLGLRSRTEAAVWLSARLDSLAKP
jgi:DNA-binding NarL/FixJ family response regulator